MTVFGGDIIYASDLNQLIDRPHTVVTLAESVPNNAITVLTPTTEQLDVGGMWDSGDPTKITVPSGGAGWYEVGVTLRYASQVTSAGTRQARINLNTVEQITFQIPTATVLNSTNIIVSGKHELALADGDDITFSAFQNSGGALSVLGNSRGWVRRLRKT
jgi:hypothetical protein